MNADDVKFQSKPEDKDKQISFEIGYIIPFWSSKPRHKYSLDIWREGVIVDTIDISKKEYYLIGRNKNICDIYLNNMTVSRVHCVIQHKDDGDIFLYDLDSVYGTSINKRPIAKKQYVKLNVGDTFKIGQSNRMFILNGPEELQAKIEVSEDNRIKTIEGTNMPGNANGSAPSMHLIDKKELMENRVKMIKELYEQRENYKRSLLGVDREEADWGQKDFDEEILQHQREEEDFYSQRERNIAEDINGSLNLEEIKERKDLSDKQRNMIQKLENLSLGMRKIKDEITKLHRREADQGELTEGQKKRIEINEKKLNDLYSKYESQESSLRISLSSKDEMGEGYVEHKFDRKLARDLDSDDEFYDRTAENKKNAGNQGTCSIITPAITENYETLKQKLENLIRNRQKLIDKLQKVDQIADSRADSEEIDSLDAFFQQTQNDLKSSQKSNITNQINEITKEINKTQKLMSLVTPSHLKIKFKTAEEEEASNISSANPQTKTQTTTTATIDSKQKKKKAESIFDTVSKLNKLSKKQAEEKVKNHVDPDEEYNEEIENFKKSLEKQIEMDDNFKRKVEEFKKSLKRGADKSNKEETRGGLIISNRNKTEDEEDGRAKDSENITISNAFEEIIENIDQPVFEMKNYSQISNVFTKKKRNDKKMTELEIDFSTGGLQTFNDYLDKLEDDASLNKNHATTSGDFIQKKRDRPVYGAVSKPADRNVDEEEVQDYDAIYTVGEKSRVEHSLNSNLYNKDRDEDY